MYILVYTCMDTCTSICTYINYITYVNKTKHLKGHQANVASSSSCIGARSLFNIQFLSCGELGDNLSSLSLMALSLKYQVLLCEQHLFPFSFLYTVKLLLRCILHRRWHYFLQLSHQDFSNLVSGLFTLRTYKYRKSTVIF